MTLPSPHYLDHPPQFIPESPPFPLTKELGRQEQTDLAPAPSGDGLPPQVPPGGLR
jgi:hypothetical protein